MIRVTESPVVAERDLYAGLPLPARDSLLRARLTLDEAAQLRAETWKYEDPLRNWETRVRAERPRGRRWKTLLAECSRAVAEAGRIHLSIYEKEQEALPHLKAATRMLRDEPRGGTRALAGPALQSLGACERHREQALWELDRMLRVSEDVVNASPKATPEQILCRLEERRRHLGESDRIKTESDAEERRAFLSGLEAMPDLSEAAARLIDPTDFESPAPAAAARAPVVVGLSDEGLRDEDWEEWLKSVGDDAPQEPAFETKTADQLEWEEAVRKASLSATGSAPAEPENPVVETSPGPEEPREETPVTNAKTTPEVETSPRPSLIGRIEGLAQELRLVQEEAEREREENLAHVSHEIESLKKSHTANIEKEAAARREAEVHLETARLEAAKARDEVAETEKQLEEVGRQIETLREHLTEVADARRAAETARHELAASAAKREDSHRKESESLRKAADEAHAALEAEREKLAAREQELNARIEELQAEAREAEAAVKEQQEAARKASEEELARRDAALAELRDSLGGKLVAAETERDEALALIASLTRRLELAGLSGGDDEDRSTLTDEMKRIRKAISGTEGEMQSLRDEFLAWRVEIESRLAGEVEAAAA